MYRIYKSQHGKGRIYLNIPVKNEVNILVIIATMFKCFHISNVNDLVKYKIKRKEGELMQIIASSF